MKKFLALFLVLMSIVSVLAGCGDSKEPDNSQTDGTAQPSGDTDTSGNTTTEK